MITKNTHRKRLVVAIIHHVIRSPERERGRTKKESRETHSERERAVFAHRIDRRPLFRRESERRRLLSLSSRIHGQKKIRVIWQFTQQRAVETTSDDDDDDDDMM